MGIGSSNDDVMRILGRIEGRFDSLEEHLPALVQEAMKETCVRVSADLCRKIGDVENDCKERDGKLDRRTEKLEKRKKLDTAIAGGGGVVGGALIIFLKRVVGWD